MTLTRSRIVGFAAAIIAAGLGLLLLTAANDANAGSGGDVPRCQGKQETVAGNAGTSGPDVMVGTGGQDEIDGGGGDDLICARAANDDVLAGGGHDLVRGGAGSDFVDGESGNDELLGNGGDDRSNRGSKRRGRIAGLFGSEGNDVLSGGSRNDVLEGGEGTDVHNGAEGFDGCFDEDPDSEFNGCEFGSVSPPR